MTRIVRIEAAGSKGDRWRVHLDDDRTCTLPADEVQRRGLSEGDRLDPGQVEDLLRSSRRQEAMDRALHYLSYRSRSRFEVERYLGRKGYEQPIVEAVLARCEELEYLDDRRFAEAWVRDRIELKPRGAARLKAELRKKGVHDPEAEEAIRSAFRAAGVTERELLERAARKRWRSRRSDDAWTLRRRLFGYLRRRGFRPSEIREVVNELVERDEPRAGEGGPRVGEEELPDAEDGLPAGEGDLPGE